MASSAQLWGFTQKRMVVDPHKHLALMPNSPLEDFSDTVSRNMHREETANQDSAGCQKPIWLCQEVDDDWLGNAMLYADLKVEGKATEERKHKAWEGSINDPASDWEMDGSYLYGCAASTAPAETNKGGYASHEVAADRGMEEL